MAFWNGEIEPLRKNRWTVSFSNSDVKDNSLENIKGHYFLKKVDRPSYKTTDITHKFGNYNFYYPGRVEWNTINMTFVANPDVDKSLLSILKMVANGPLDAQNALKGVNKTTFNRAIGQVVIKQLGSDPSLVIEKWTLQKPFFTNIKFGDLSYDSDEVIDIDCTIRFDTAEFSSTRELKNTVS